MRKLLKGGNVINVFTGNIIKANVLIEDDTIIGVGEYDTADIIEDVSGKFLCPGFIDGHIHIESTMMTSPELARVSLAHGTTTIVADPHEIANVCGTAGIEYMLASSKNLPLNVYIMLPSCVPASGFDESGACLDSQALSAFYSEKRVLGLAEMMNYPGVIYEDESVLSKIKEANKLGKHIDGHAPLLSGKELDKYISYGISTDHECSCFAEACEKIEKGQWVMIREGSGARNLSGLIDLFSVPWCRRCILVTDDKHPHDLISEGHIDFIIRKAVSMGKDAIVAVQMATIQAAMCFGLKNVGAIAPSYKADIVVMNNLENVDICDVYVSGKKVCDNKNVDFNYAAEIDDEILKKVYDSFNLKPLDDNAFYIENKGKKCRVIKTIPGQLLTEEYITNINFEINNGIDLQRDILKIAVVERHKQSGHRGVGFISGIGLKQGAIASSVAHDSHNIVVIGTNDEDMVLATNRIIALGGGYVAVNGGKIISELALPIAGLMSEKSAEEISKENEILEKAIASLGANVGSAPLMTMAFMSLSVIPNLKMTTKGLVDVNKQQLVSLFAE